MDRFDPEHHHWEDHGGTRSLRFKILCCKLGGDLIKIKDRSIGFRCAMDNNASVHTYPRPSDPISGKWVAITAASVNTFTINVGSSPLLSFHSGIIFCCTSKWVWTCTVFTSPDYRLLHHLRLLLSSEKWNKCFALSTLIVLIILKKNTNISNFLI